MIIRKLEALFGFRFDPSQLDKASSTILRMLDDGSSGLKKMRQEARDLGYILDDGSVESALRTSF